MPIIASERAPGQVWSSTDGTSIGAPSPLICHVIYRLAVGGLENGLVNLINHLPVHKYRHAIICVDRATDFRRRIQRGDTEIYEIHKREGKDIAAYGRMVKLLRQLRPWVVHTRNLPALDMLFPAWLAGVPRLVHSEHGLDMAELNGMNQRYNRLRRVTGFVVDRYITVSSELRDWLTSEVRVPGDRVELIYNGVDTDRFSPVGADRDSLLPPGFAPPNAIVVGMFGRLEPVKNPLGVASAFLRVLETRPALRKILRLMVVGEGSERKAIETLLAHGNASELAWLPGQRDDTPELYRALDLFVLSSHREGISNTILEAMASGRPVIATGVGGTPEILPDGATGRIVPPGDTDAIAAAILHYIDNPDLMRVHGRAARLHTVNKFSLSGMVGNYDEFYHSLLHRD